MFGFVTIMGSLSLKNELYHVEAVGARVVPLDDSVAKHLSISYRIVKLVNPRLVLSPAVTQLCI